MTRSNRTLNRLILLIIGLAAIAAAAGLAFLATPWSLAGTLGIRIPRVDLGDQTLLWAIAGGAVVVIVLAICWIATRGRGRTSTAVDTPEMQIDTRAMASVLRGGLAASTDVVGVHVTAFRRRSGRVVLAEVQTRPGADLPHLADTVRRSVAQVDSIVGLEIPLIVHLTTGVRSAFASGRATR